MSKYIFTAGVFVIVLDMFADCTHVFTSDATIGFGLIGLALIGIACIAEWGK